MNSIYIFLTIILPLSIGILATWLVSRHFYLRSCSDLTRLIKKITKEEKTDPNTSAYRLLYDLISAFEHNEIYWPEFDMAVKIMKRVGEVGTEALDRIRDAASKEFPLTPPFFEALEKARLSELEKLKRHLTKQLKGN